MKAPQIVETVKVAYRAKRPVFLHGQPGAGKSALVRKAAEELAKEVNPNFELRDVRASQLESVDLRGLPHIEGNITLWSIPAFLPSDPKSCGILFLDELNQASQSTQAAAYQLILDRRLGDYILPDGWIVVAAGNRAIDRAIVNKMGSALKNRFFHAELEVCQDEWIKWAVGAGIHPSIIGYIRFRPQNLNDLAAFGTEGKKKMEIALEGNAFSTPRSWEIMSDIIKTSPHPDIEVELIEGTIGKANCADYLAFLKIYRDLPDLDAVLMNPEKAPVPKDLPVLWAMSTGLGTKACKDNIHQVVAYINRIPKEFQVVTMKDAQVRDFEITTTKAYNTWMIDNVNVF